MTKDNFYFVYQKKSSKRFFLILSWTAFFNIDNNQTCFLSSTSVYYNDF